MGLCDESDDTRVWKVCLVRHFSNTAAGSPIDLSKLEEPETPAVDVNCAKYVQKMYTSVTLCKHAENKKHAKLQTE